MSVCAWLLKSTVSVNINQLDHGGFRDCGMGYGGGSTLYFVGNISMYDQKIGVKMSCFHLTLIYVDFLFNYIED